jgi:hypothetical protein
MNNSQVQTAPGDSCDFSLVLGGPLYEVFRRTHLCGKVLELLRRRLVVLCGIVWLPMFGLSALEGTAWGGAVKLPFIFDLEVHARFLVAMPLLIVAELGIHDRMKSIVGQFLERQLISENARPRFDAAVASALRLRNSVLAEVILLVSVYALGAFLGWREHASLDVASWSGALTNGRLQPSLAGWWFGLISIPLFQFLLLRWYYRIFIWARFLRQVSRLELNLIPSHPDRSAGLGFLSLISFAFFPLLLAQGALVAGMIADHIFFAGAKLTQFKPEIAGLVVVAELLVIGPLLVFARRLGRLKRNALCEYGALAQRYVSAFEEKWLRGGAPPGEALLGSADLQSLADLGGSFEVVKQMRPVPFTAQTIAQAALVTLVPVLPLLLTMISAKELLQRLLKVVF